MKTKLLIAFIALVILSSGFVAVFLFQKKITSQAVKNTHALEQENLKSEKIITGKGKNNNQDQVQPVMKKELKISFFGDLMLDRSVRQQVNRKGVESLFSQSQDLLEQSEVNIANLEGPVADFVSKSVDTKEEQPAHFLFVFDPKSLAFFKTKNFHYLNLGNNHILNFGQEGLLQTKKNLEQNSVQYFGQPGENNNFLLAEIKGIKVGLVNYNQFEKGSQNRALEQMKNLQKSAGLVIVYTHWGQEYQPLPNNNQVTLAHQFIDAGADVIIGSHPHVIQPIEEYQGKYIFYSLGNFVFDQFFSKETKEGLSVGLNYNQQQDRFSFSLVPFQMTSGFKIQKMQGIELENLLNNLANNSTVSEEVKGKIKKRETRVSLKQSFGENVAGRLNICYLL